MSNRYKITDIKEQYNLLHKLERYFKSDLKLTPCIGAEIEFYLRGELDIRSLEEKIGHKIKAERGNNQYEIDLPPSMQIADYAKYIEEMRQKIIDQTDRLGAISDFSSKPFIDGYGSAMHIHLNFLEDADRPENIEKYAKILCHYLPEAIDSFLPAKEDYQRLDSDFMAPTHICYGGNNRSVLIRVPDSKPLRLEHRLAAANANPAQVIYTILQSIAEGLRNTQTITPIEKIFGNAFDPQYRLQKISANIKT